MGMDVQKKLDKIIHSPDQLANLIGRYQKVRNKDLYHYTIWSSLAKMMKPAVVEHDGERHSCRMLWLSSACGTNDRTEEGLGHNVFFTCFSREAKENVAMWTNYGVPKSEAVRVRIKDADMVEWFEKLRLTKRIYRVDVDKQGHVSYTRIMVDEPDGIDIRFDDVRYWSDDFEVFDKQANGANPVELRIDTHRVKVDASVAQMLMKGGGVNADACFRKKIGWAYEKEARLVVRLKKDVSLSRIAVEFDEPLEKALNDPGRNIQRGPWYSSSRHYDEIGRVSIYEVEGSDYQDELNMRSICSGCGKSQGCFCERRDAEVRRRIKPKNERLALERLKTSKDHDAAIDQFLRCIQSNIAVTVGEIEYEATPSKLRRHLEDMFPTRDSVLEWLMCETRRKATDSNLAQTLDRSLRTLLQIKEKKVRSKAIHYLMYEVVLYLTMYLLRQGRIDVINNLVSSVDRNMDGQLYFRGMLENLNPSQILDIRDEYGNDVPLVEWMKRNAFGGPEIMIELAYADFCLYILISARYGHCSWLPPVFDAYKEQLAETLEKSTTILASARRLPFDDYQKVLQGRAGVTFPRQQEFRSAIERIRKSVQQIKR